MEIRVSNQKVLIDDEDLYLVSRYKWSVRNGYVVTRSKGWRLHRLILGIHLTKYHHSQQVDHINRNPLDNRKLNLRICNAQQNGCNKVINTKIQKTSLYKGVYKYRNRWRVTIKLNGKTISFRSYATEIEAAKVYDEAAKKHFGEYASTNF